MDRDALFDEGIDLFNRGYFFEAHDVWEEIWQEVRGPMRNFYKGLIHLAGGFHHFQNENFRGSVALLTSGVGYLKPFLPGRQGLDLAAILPEVERELEKVIRLRNGASGLEDVIFPSIVRAR